MNVTAELFLSANMMVYFWTGKHSTNICTYISLHDLLQLFWGLRAEGVYYVKFLIFFIEVVQVGRVVCTVSGLWYF